MTSCNSFQIHLSSYPPTQCILDTEKPSLNSARKDSRRCNVGIIHNRKFKSTNVGWFYSPLLGPYSSFSFVILYTVGWTPWTGDQPVARPLPTHRTQTQQICMAVVGFEPTNAVFERAMTVHAGHRNRRGDL
jgi:hypothetical protein